MQYLVHLRNTVTPLLTKAHIVSRQALRAIPFREASSVGVGLAPTPKRQVGEGGICAQTARRATARVSPASRLGVSLPRSL